MARRAAKPAPAANAEIEVVSKPGLGLDDGIVLTTFFLLAGAITLVVLALQAYE